jgi:hypothetical protein
VDSADERRIGGNRGEPLASPPAQGRRPCPRASCDPRPCPLGGGLSGALGGGGASCVPEAFGAKCDQVWR